LAIAATYTYVESSAQGRADNVGAHLAFLERLTGDGILLAVGRVDDAPFSILFALASESVDDALARLSDDPYNKLGFISKIDAYVWTAKLGVLAPL
jgi:uncharacterized protein YciI